jgi:hypothetical protein
MKKSFTIAKKQKIETKTMSLHITPKIFESLRK